MNVRPLAKFLVTRPRTVIIVYTIFTVLIATNITHIYMQSDLTSFLPASDPTVKLWNKINDEFQIGKIIIIYVEADDIRSPEVLKEMDRVTTYSLVNKYEGDHGVYDGIFSVKSIAQYIKEENGKAEIPGGLGGTGVYEIPESTSLIFKYMSRLTIQEVKGTLYTNDYKVAVILLQLSDQANYDEIQESVEEAIARRGTFFTEMTITGSTAMQNAIRDSSMESFKLIFAFTIVFVSIVLFIFHRSVKGIIIALCPTAFSIALTFGVLGAIQPELTLLSISIIALLLGLGVDYSCHIMNRFAEEQSKVTDAVDITEKILKTSGKALLASVVTTIIGFGSLMISSMLPIVFFGFGCAMGMFFCFISTILLTPSLSVLLKFKKTGSIPRWDKLADIVLNNKKRIVILAVFFAVMSLLVLPRIESDVNYIDLAPQGIPEVEKLIEYSENFGGANFNALLVETEPQGLTYPEVINAIYEMETEMRVQGINLYSVVDEVKKLNDILERNDIIASLSEYAGVDEVIFDRIAQEGLVDEDFSKTIILVYIPAGLSISEIEEKVTIVNTIAAQTELPRNGLVSQLTGQDATTVAINKQLTNSQTQSMIISILLVLATLIFIFSSSLYGFLTMIPVAFILLWEPGLLVSFDIPLNVITMNIASIMIGVGIDYGIHITLRFREEIDQGLTRAKATRIAVERTGLSLIEAALTTIAGVAAILLVNIPALREFAVVIILMVAFSFVGAVLILPVFFGFKILK